MMAESCEEFPNKANIKAAVDFHFARIANEIHLPLPGSVYAIDDAFGTLATYWKDKVRAARFTPTEPPPTPRGHGREDDAWMDPNAPPAPKGDRANLANHRLHVLYRANPTDDLFERVEESFISWRRTMVTGPPGIGKSHSIVNLVLKLQASGKYLVTFIPDCSQWHTVDFLLLAICGSLGIDPGPNGIGLHAPPLGASWEAWHVDLVMRAITEELDVNKKKWIFVFDEVTNLFRWDPNSNWSSFKIRYLPYPFSLIQHVTRNLVTSVISASWTHPSFFFDNQDFADFKHVTQMTDSELNSLFLRVPVVALKKKLDPIKKLAGGVPHYVKRYIELGEPDKFVDAAIKEIHPWLQKMMQREWTWKFQLDSIMRCLLGREATSNTFYDMKYMIRQGESGSRFLKPLFPAVVNAYRRQLLEEIIQHVEREQSCLRLCRADTTSPDVVGRLFEYLLIQRIKSDGLNLALFSRGHGIQGE
jgi:hypothetical protein